MAYDESVAERLRMLFTGRLEIVEKKMFGGVVFMLSGNMLCGVIKDAILARVGPEQYEEALTCPFTKEMDLTGRPMRGLVIVEPDGFETKAQLETWVQLCEIFVGALPVK